MFSPEELNNFIENIKQKIYIANANGELEQLLDNSQLKITKQNIHDTLFNLITRGVITV